MKIFKQYFYALNVILFRFISDIFSIGENNVTLTIEHGEQNK